MDDILNEVEDDGEEVMTAQAVLNILQEAWVNEHLAPELLPHKSEFVEVMMEQIEQMEENVNLLESNDLRSLIHKQELERIKYLMRSYLRLRLEKIELYSINLFKSTGILSNEEVKFLKEYTTSTVETLKLLCSDMPGIYSQMSSKEIEITPDLNKYVFVKSKETLRDALLIQDGGSEEEVVVEKDSQHILPYSAVREQIKSSKMILI